MPKLRPYPHHPLSIEDKVLLGIRRLERRMDALEALARRPPLTSHAKVYADSAATTPRNRRKGHS